jgi:hypothetical protein
MTTAQNRAVWASANKLGIDSEMLHDIVQEMFGVDSLKKVNEVQAIYLLRRLNNNNSPYSYLPKNPYGMEYASHKQIAKIKALFNECGFQEPKRKEWLFRAKSLKSEMNISSMSSDEIVKKLKAKEATSLIASLVKVKKYLDGK